MNCKFFGGWFRSAIITLLPTLALMVAPSAHAALIGVQPAWPDITTNSTDITYSFVTGTGGTMTINGTAASNLAAQTVKFFNGDVAHNICASNVLNSSCNPATQTTYSLTANFNASGIFTGGTLSILGYVDGDTSSNTTYQPYAGLANSGTLLTANLTAFGFNGSAGTSIYDNLLLDFTGIRTGGDFGAFHGLKWNGHVNSSGLATYGGNWDLQAAPFTKSFSCTGASGCLSTLDTFVPLPAAFWLFGSGLIGLFGVATRARKRRTD
jgi:hypothetical protein